MLHQIVSSLLLVTCLCLPAGAQELVDVQPVEMPGGVEAERGRLVVPLRHGEPDGKTIEIAYLRIKGDASVPPVFVLAGGPGDSGIRVAEGMARAPQARGLFMGDIVGIDQRGVGASVPNLDVNVDYGVPMNEPFSREAVGQRVLEEWKQIAEKCESDGVDLAAFNSQENADDIDALRAALGYETMDLWGVSYGSHLALAVLKRHEDSVDRVFLASPEGPHHTLKRPALVQAAIERRLGNDEEMLSALKSAKATLDEGPATVTLPSMMSADEEIVVGPEDLERFILQIAQSPAPTMALRPPVVQLGLGDFTQLGQWARQDRRNLKVTSAMKLAMDVASGASEERREQIKNESAVTLTGNAINFPIDLPGAAEALGVEPLPASFHEAVQSDRPVLIMVGTNDIRTPIENAREIAQTLPNAKLLIVRDGFHGFRPTPAVLAVLKQFFADRDNEMPAEQTVQ